jgi:two-component system, OmpR family, alkaline phosphatase synthesis response regulator PhoP
MMKQHILLAEDEPGLVLTLTDRLLHEGFSVSSARDGVLATTMGLQPTFDLILLDVLLPRRNGFEVCHQLRQGKCRTPILMLTALGDVADRVRGLDLGADDYLQKPFAMKELLARIHALLRRSKPALPGPQTVGQCLVDFDAGTAMRDNTPQDLSPQSLRLLAYLIAHPGEAITRDTLLAEVWGHKATVTTRTVDMHIAFLRRAIEADPRTPRHILTVHTVGYRFDA